MDAKFTIVVGADHSTPVLFGDHSHEPAPFAIAHMEDVIRELGEDGEQSVAVSAMRCRM